MLTSQNIHGFLCFTRLLLVLLGILSSGVSEEVTRVQVKEGASAVLPCDISIPTDEDDTFQGEDYVTIILWYKDDGSYPVHVVDNRANKGVLDGTHPQPVGYGLIPRITLNTTKNTAILFIQKTQSTDAGVYRCRVDFRHSKTRNQRIKLDIV